MIFGSMVTVGAYGRGEESRGEQSVEQPQESDEVEREGCKLRLENKVPMV